LGAGHRYDLRKQMQAAGYHDQDGLYQYLSKNPQVMESELLDYAYMRRDCVLAVCRGRATHARELQRATVPADVGDAWLAELVVCNGPPARRPSIEPPA
jgi:hypothetical protein